MNFLFLMKPLSVMDAKKDTTLVFIEEVFRRGYRAFYLAQGAASLTQDGEVFSVQELLPNTGSGFPLILGESVVLNERDVSHVFVRTDPPFDLAYLHDMWVLDRCKDVVCVNDPKGIITVNEKLWVTQFQDLIPPTCVSTSCKVLLDFCQQHESIVLKPTDGFGGQGVFKTSAQDSNIMVMLEQLTQQGRYAIAQGYVPDSENGDKRVLLFDGEILGAVMRVHSGQDHRNNFFAGGHAEAATITSRDREIVSTLAPSLEKLGLRFVGIDIIGGYLIECNVTSPTCLREMNALSGQSLEKRVFDGLGL